MKRGTTAIRRLSPWLVAASLVSPFTLAQETPQTLSQAEFGQCIGKLKGRAMEAGVTPEVAQNVLDQVTFLDRVIELDRRQPEFTTTFADYLNRRVNDARIEKGRELLDEHADLLAKVTRETGVPAPYLVAFWGLETNFGSYFGKMSVPSALATLACDPRRSDYFSGELISALRIIDEGAIPPEQMEGSWAGAMGHVQFMPSVFLRYAVDADNDGKRDLWHSIPDAMMSAGNFLQNLGWNGDYRWGREVLLPENFDYSLAGLKNEQALSEWRKLNIKDAFGNKLPNADIEASLLVPAGHEGPAFLVYHNFHVIMGWNRSEFYAIAVGHLADRIAGAGGLQNPPPEDLPRLSREDIEALQSALNQRGYESGTPDGILGPATRGAIRDFQKDQNRIADGYPDPGLFEALQIKLKEAEASNT
ncbi:lytic murein transglycosylase [Marinobacter nanhaiticus D15-8W]|uniref:Lytic murein transglycosylase n=1 Tax=Marinobacter nanhaiticus D15-8W TaxID=626887 RepID=N6WX33_9GAMM|nr:lytic murein transglycosylase [Marinobacter nanhaiticus D15-8W]BES73523.1 lytic murein transglycosylase [Marinobacter nanhaiticus D15-8W]